MLHSRPARCFLLPSIIDIAAMLLIQPTRDASSAFVLKILDSCRLYIERRPAPPPRYFIDAFLSQSSAANSSSVLSYFKGK